MDEVAAAFGSDTWLSDLQILACNVLENLRKRPHGQFLRYRDKLLGTTEAWGEIVKEYHRLANELKFDIFGKNAYKSHLDRHKIAALYIRALLLYQPFVLEIPKVMKGQNPCLKTMLPNEYFCIAFLATMFKGWQKTTSKRLKIDIHYKFDFIRLLYRYRKNIDILDPLSLSNIIFLIEKQYFH